MGNGCCNRTSVQTEVDRIEIAPQAQITTDLNKNRSELLRIKKFGMHLPEASGELYFRIYVYRSKHSQD